MDITTVKCIVLMATLLVTMVFSLLPLRMMATYRHTQDMAKRAKFSQFIGLMSCFAGGVFMATGLLDLFPEVQDNVEKGLDLLHIHTSFPVPEFIVVFGFLFVVVLEQIVLDCKHSDQPIAHEVPQADLEQSTEVLEDGERSLGSEIPDPTDHVHPSLRSVLLVAALSLHSVLEGVAIGLQPSVDSVVQISAAVMLHKAVIAFSLGLNLVQSALGLTAILQSCLIFCSTSPIGIGLGMLADEMGHTPESILMNGVLQGLACGTFIYVTFFEVLPRELSNGIQRLPKVLAVLIGFSSVCGVLFLDPS
ncbi:zinc transporter ZIP1-like [Neocloeon triangulifer]|uniref:zinc transporter ZIP1-like n=1 Tax=Neocloeon triangulifer TaxID=2078957 RepID=UPI00286F5BB2|nr:zinc transporter ZIP1-like [Neocloeon triangulifer]